MSERIVFGKAKIQLCPFRAKALIFFSSLLIGPLLQIFSNVKLEL
jgi:hypothetical protein